MNSENNQGQTTRTGRSRRAFLASGALVALTGCTLNVDLGRGAGGQQTAASTPRPTATATETSTTTATEAPTSTATETPTATPTPEDTEFEVLTVQPEVQPANLVTVTPTPESERYRLERLYLYVESAADGAFDGPNTEELYGRIHARATADGVNWVTTTVGQSRIWDVDENSPREIAEGNGRILDLDFTPVEFVFPDPDSFVRSEAYIEVRAQLIELDKGANQNDIVMDSTTDRWYLTENPSPENYVADSGESYFVHHGYDGKTHVTLSYNVTAV